MKSVSLRRWLCLMLTLTLPVSLALADAGPTAMLLPRGQVLLNGARVSRSSAVFQGDTIETHDGSVVLTLTGTSLSIPERSRVAFEGKTIHLFEGGAMVATSQGLVTHTARLSITPVNGTATYQVARGNGQVRIVAQHGVLAISGAKTLTLPEGQSITLNEDDNRQGGLPPVTAGGTAGSNALPAIIGASAATGAALCAYYCGGDKGKASETRP